MLQSTISPQKTEDHSQVLLQKISLLVLENNHLPHLSVDFKGDLDVCNHH